MRKIFFAALAGFVFETASAQIASTDIYLVDYAVKGTMFYFTPPINITHRPGYDNQPSFSPDGGKVYYTSYRDTIQSDIYVYDINDSTTEQITHSPESEFSPRLTKDQMGLNIIRVDEDKAQRFYKILLDGTDANQAVSATDSAAYYGWVNDSTIAMAVLNGNAMDLNVYEMPSEQFIPLAKNVGRCILAIPGSESEFSYVDKSDTNGFVIMRFSTIEGLTNTITALPKGVEDYTWTHDGKILCGKEGKLFMFDPTTPERTWFELVDFSKSVGVFYRIVSSPVGNTLALVAFKDDVKKPETKATDDDKKDDKKKKKKKDKE